MEDGAALDDETRRAAAAMEAGQARLRAEIRSLESEMERLAAARDYRGAERLKAKRAALLKRLPSAAPET